jgi:IclR family transcriptional regulator, KDG regulon repressor
LVSVKNFTAKTVGALGISGPIWRRSSQALQGRAKTVRAAASQLSAEFGAVAQTRHYGKEQGI